MDKKRLIIFIDSGDTLVDESSEIRKVPGGVVYEASLVPGAADALRELKAQGYRIALVADGLTESFYHSYGK
ncbi:MAG: HAD family hydrolase, partial [Blautia sp.]|nr:HAD family hydrolase [Blautia sp.]